MKENDIIVFKYEGTTLSYKVVQNIDHNTYYLSCCGVKNDKIFDLLGISDRFSFCSAIVGYTLTNTSVAFPEVNTSKDLEKIVDALYQRIIDISTPKFKEGEMVKILPKDGSELSYPNGYVIEMTRFANSTDTIANVNKMSVDLLKRCISLEKYQEPFGYCLQDHSFVWTSAMLESANKDEIKKEEVLPPKFNIGDKVKIKMLDLHCHYGVYLSSDMLQYCGQEFVIRNHRRETKLQNEKCDGYVYSLKNIYFWVWSSDMLEKCENTTKHELDTAPWTTSEPRDLSVMQKESVELYDAIKTNSIPLSSISSEADIITQTITLGNIKATISGASTIPLEEEKDSSVDYKLNFTVNSLDF